MLLRVPGDHSAETAAAMIREVASLPDYLRQSFTWDRGTELADYAKIQTGRDHALLVTALAHGSEAPKRTSGS